MCACWWLCGQGRQRALGPGQRQELGACPLFSTPRLQALLTRSTGSRGRGDMQTKSCLVPGLEKNLVFHLPHTEGKNRQEEELPRRPLAPARVGAGAGEWALGWLAVLCLGVSAPEHFTAPKGE